MSKYIDLMLALNKLWKLCVEDIDAEISEPETFDFGRARDALSDLPTIDIVRCKECRHGEYREDFDDYLCDILGLGVVNDADFFCSDGERIDNE